jgi:hypothetical protein
MNLKNKLIKIGTLSFSIVLLLIVLTLADINPIKDYYIKNHVLDIDFIMNDLGLDLSCRYFNATRFFSPTNPKFSCITRNTYSVQDHIAQSRRVNTILEDGGWIKEYEFYNDKLFRTSYHKDNKFKLRIETFAGQASRSNHSEKEIYINYSYDYYNHNDYSYSLYDENKKRWKWEELVSAGKNIELSGDSLKYQDFGKFKYFKGGYNNSADSFYVTDQDEYRNAGNKAMTLNYSSYDEGAYNYSVSLYQFYNSEDANVFVSELNDDLGNVALVEKGVYKIDDSKQLMLVWVHKNILIRINARHEGLYEEEFLDSLLNPYRDVYPID